MKIHSIKDVVNLVEQDPYYSMIKTFFRGQRKDWSILPKAYRGHDALTKDELEFALKELKNQSPLISHSNQNIWDWLTYAQHFGLETNLVDWTTNPLIALWFACEHVMFDEKNEEDAYFYLLNASMFPSVNGSLDGKPWELSSPYILEYKPSNPRIFYQNACFTVHPYRLNTNKKFIPLSELGAPEENPILKFPINGKKKSGILIDLDKFGVNQFSIFRDELSLCNTINWRIRKYLYPDLNIEDTIPDIETTE